MNRNIIWLEKAAKKWDDGLPVGNGRLGAMVMGKVNEETIVINEETLWYGPPRNRRNPDAYSNIDKIRQLLLEGKLSEAEFEAKLALTSTPKYNNPFQPAGDLRLCFKGHEGKVSGYRRSLDIDNAIAYVGYEVNGVVYKREILACAEYNVLAIRLTCSAGGMTLCANVNRKPFEEHSGKLDEKTVGNWGVNGVGGVSYLTCARITADTEAFVKGDFVYVRDAKEIVIFLASGTNFGGNENFREDVINRLNRAEKAGYEEVKRIHLKEYHNLYNRFEFYINQTETKEEPTNRLLERLKQGDTEPLSYLTMLLLNYARYLIISSSYRCQMPSNLQGIWNGSFEPPWQSQYTINVNTEMNYWFVEKAGLAECHMPLFNLIERMAVNGRETAKELYGCRGFCAHHNTNLWACTDPEGIFAASPFWPMGGAWLSLHMYEHYLYTQDEDFLKNRALPVMREAIRFIEDYLYDDGSGQLLTGPSVSPENTYCLPNGERAALCMAPTMDSMIIRQLITWYIEGCRITGVIDDISNLERICVQLPETKLTKDGRIMEWYKDFEEAEPGHRHISHLFGLHPGVEITSDTTETFEAAKKTVEYRLKNGGGHTGWSKAWVTCFYARLRDGKAVGENICELLQKSILDNMLDVHPPFQIDGNFGIAEAMIEALIQSHAGYIDILPALPPSWKDGRLGGVRLRGGMEAELSWEGLKLSSLRIRAQKSCNIRVRYNNNEQLVELSAGIWKQLYGNE